MSQAKGALHGPGDGLALPEKAPQPLHGWQAVLHGRYNTGDPAIEPCSFTPHVAAVPRAGATSAIASPPESYAVNTAAAEQKHHYPLPKLLVLGVLAGAYIGLGYSLCMLVGGQLSHELRHSEPGLFNFLFGIFGFPMGLTLCVVAGADLFTSNCMYATFAVSEGRYGLLGAARCLLTSYSANLLGSLLLIALMLGGDVFKGREDFVVELALKKVSLPFGAVVCRGILCNWLVCLAVWQGNMARDLTGKFVGIFLPNSAFVSMGFEHCIANMYLIPLSMCLGSGISVGTFLGRNLVPATLGNLIGGCLFVGAAYACSFGTPAHAVADIWAAALDSSKACLTGRRRTRPAAGAAHSSSHSSLSNGRDGAGAAAVGAPPPLAPPGRSDSFAHVCDAAETAGLKGTSAYAAR